jgi:hypothetical protein
MVTNRCTKSIATAVLAAGTLGIAAGFGAGAGRPRGGAAR